MRYSTAVRTIFALVAVAFATSSVQAQVGQWRTNRRMTQVTILPNQPSAALIQPTPANQGPGRWQTNRPMISSGYEMPTKALFLGGYAGRNYGHGIRQGYVPAGPGSAQGELRMIELKPIR
jgi:hypothetical protein